MLIGICHSLYYILHFRYSFSHTRHIEGGWDEIDDSIEEFFNVDHVAVEAIEQSIDAFVEFHVHDVRPGHLLALFDLCDENVSPLL